jgi:hypothetical protein
MSGVIFNATFENLKMRNTGCGPRMKAERGRGAAWSTEPPTATPHCVQRAADGSDYACLPRGYTRATNATATPIFRNFAFENVRFVGGSNAGIFVGLPESHLWSVSVSGM